MTAASPLRTFGIKLLWKFQERLQKSTAHSPTLVSYAHSLWERNAVVLELFSKANTLLIHKCSAFTSVLTPNRTSSKCLSFWPHNFIFIRECRNADTVFVHGLQETHTGEQLLAAEMRTSAHKTATSHHLEMDPSNTAGSDEWDNLLPSKASGC